MAGDTHDRTHQNFVFWGCFFGHPFSTIMQLSLMAVYPRRREELTTDGRKKKRFKYPRDRIASRSRDTINLIRRTF
jgi:hypothetical protein